MLLRMSLSVGILSALATVGTLASPALVGLELSARRNESVSSRTLFYCKILQATTGSLFVAVHFSVLGGASLALGATLSARATRWQGYERTGDRFVAWLPLAANSFGVGSWAYAIGLRLGSPARFAIPVGILVGFSNLAAGVLVSAQGLS
jgi:hypothetical protein